ncbi:retrovirus-related pol polyprotein from transposon TNT 1-94 [Tanacetum coccineum]
MHDKKLDLSFLHVFGSLCYPTNDSEDLGRLDAKADIRIFFGYAPAKKAFRIYNRRTQKIMETIHVTFDELTSLASKQFSSGLGLKSMTLATSSSGLASNPIPQQHFPAAVAPRAMVLADSHVSTSIDQDAPSTQEQEHSLIISQVFEESPKIPLFHDDPLHESLHEDSTSQGSSSNVRPTYTPFEHLGKIAKLRKDIFMFQQCQDGALYVAWTRFKDLLWKVPHHGLDLWLQAGDLRKLRPEEAWKTIKDLAQYDEEEWNELIFSKKESPDYIDANLEQELESMECRVESLMRNEVLMYYEVGFTFPKRPYQEELEG